MDVCCLGPVQARRAGEDLDLGGPKPRLVLASLVVAGGHAVSIDQLIDTVWDEAPPASARNTLQTYVSHLRRALGRAAITGNGWGYALDLDQVEVDVTRFERLVAESRDLLQGDPTTAIAVLQEALALWRGRPFADLLEHRSLQGHIARLEELRATTTELVLEAQLESGAAREVVTDLEVAVTEAPLRERRWALLMLGLYRCGRQADALLAFERARAALADAVGADPSAPLRRLHARILAQDPTLGGDDRFRSGDPASSEGHRLPVPTSLLTGTTVPFVGRHDLLEDLQRRAKAAAVEGRSAVVLFAGEPGVGKTRTAVQVAAAASDAGVQVLAGRCDPHLSVPYQPFAEMLDQQSHLAPELPLGRLPGELVRLLPELPTRVGDLPPPVRSDPRVEEHRLYDATTDWLVSVSSDTGAVVLIDDLQWATEPTLRLLTHLTRSAIGDPRARLLILGTFRETEPEGRPRLQRLLAGLARLEDRCQVIELEPLNPTEVAALVAASLDGDSDDEADALTRMVLDRTDGNPFLVGEVVRHHLDTVASPAADPPTVHDGRAATVPSGVLQLVTDRLNRLPRAAQEVLVATAILGGDADLGLLAGLVPGGTDEALAGLEAALQAQLVVESHPERFQVNHALIRDAILSTVSPLRRRRLHARAVDVLASSRPTDVSAQATQALQAMPVEGMAHRAVDLAVAAGDEALRRRASGDAVTWFTRALDVEPAWDERGRDDHRAVRLRLGEARRDAGDPAYRETLLAVAQEALADDDLPMATAAAIANHRPGTVSTVGDVDTDRVDILEQILAGIERGGPVPATDRARVMALLSLELTFDHAQVARRLDLADRALELAGTLADPGFEAWIAMTVRMPLTVPERAIQLIPLVRQAVVRADADGDPALRCATRVAAHQSLLSIGAFEESRRLIGEAVELAETEGAPFLQMLARFNAVQYLLYDGHLEQAAEEGLRCLTFSQEIGEEDGAAWWGALAALTALQVGQPEAFAEPLGGFAEQYPRMRAWRAAHLMFLASGAQRESARQLLRHHALHPADLPRDWVTASGLSSLAVLAFELADADLGGQVVDALLPLRDQWIHVHIFCSGPVEFFLGLAYHAAGDHDRAVPAIREGLRLLQDRGLRSHVPRTAWLLARVLLARDAPGDRADAELALRQGRDDAVALDMEAMVGHLDDLLASS